MDISLYEVFKVRFPAGSPAGRQIPRPFRSPWPPPGTPPGALPLQSLSFISRPFRALSFWNKTGSRLLSHAVPSTVSSAARALTLVFGMGTRVSRGRIAASCFLLPLPGTPALFQALSLS